MLSVWNTNITSWLTLSVSFDIIPWWTFCPIYVYMATCPIQKPKHTESKFLCSMCLKHLGRVRRPGLIWGCSLHYEINLKVIYALSVSAGTEGEERRGSDQKGLYSQTPQFLILTSPWQIWVACRACDQLWRLVKRVRGSSLEWMRKCKKQSMNDRVSERKLFWCFKYPSFHSSHTKQQNHGALGRKSQVVRWNQCVNASGLPQ